MRPIEDLSRDEQRAWEHLNEAERKVVEARLAVIRVTNREASRRSLSRQHQPLLQVIRNDAE